MKRLVISVMCQTLDIHDIPLNEHFPPILATNKMNTQTILLPHCLCCFSRQHLLLPLCSYCRIVLSANFPMTKLTQRSTIVTDNWRGSSYPPIIIKDFRTSLGDGPCKVLGHVRSHERYWLEVEQTRKNLWSLGSSKSSRPLSFLGFQRFEWRTTSIKINCDISLWFFALLHILHFRIFCPRPRWAGSFQI